MRDFKAENEVSLFYVLPGAFYLTKMPVFIMIKFIVALDWGLKDRAWRIV